MIVDLVLDNAKAYIDNRIVDCCLAIDQGKIVKIGKEASMPKAETRINLKNMLALPGLIDVHVHLRDEGKAYKEDFYSGTAAAALGGMTTVLDMPNNRPVTMDVGTLRERMRIAERKILVNVGFFSEFPENMKETREIIKEGAVAFKLYLANQVGGLDIDDDHALRKAFEIVGKLKVPVAVHAEDKATLKRVEDESKQVKYNDIDAFLKAHSETVEVTALKRLLNIAKENIVHLHFCHISTEKGLRTIIDGKKSGMRMSCEATPHHLFLSTDDLRQIGSLALTMPPVREEHHIAALWNGIRNCSIDILASDHAPHTLREKIAKVIWDVEAGIPGVETTLPLLLTEVKRGRLSITDIVRLMAEKPSQIFGLKSRGYLTEGNNADLVIVDFDRKYRIKASEFYSKAKYSPFDGWNVEGKPVKTFVNGRLIMDEGDIIGEARSGEIVQRE